MHGHVRADAGGWYRATCVDRARGEADGPQEGEHVIFRKARLGRGLAMVGALAFAVLLASPGSATPATLKRSVQNLTQWPLDVVTAPVTSGLSIYRNLREIDDSPAVRIAYPVPGYFWNLMVNWGASVLRGVSGVIEFLPGIALAFTDAEMTPLFDPAEQNPALVSYETGIYDLRFGIDYTTPGY